MTTSIQTWFELMRKHVVLVVAVIVHIISVGGLVYGYQTPTKVPAPVSLPDESAFPTPTVSGVPVEISIPSVQVQLKVEPGQYDKSNDSWTLSGYNAHFATITRPANNAGGNTFIYGHNNRHVFGPMKNAGPGTEARITTDIGNTFYYSLISTKTVDPGDVSIFTYVGEPILTIQTCTGLWHEQRELYTFKLTRFEESQQSTAVRNEAQRQQTLHAVATVLSPGFNLAPQSDDETSQPLAASSQQGLEEDSDSQTQETHLEWHPAALIKLEQPMYTQLL